MEWCQFAKVQIVNCESEGEILPGRTFREWISKSFQSVRMQDLKSELCELCELKVHI